MSNPKNAAFFCVANKKLIEDGQALEVSDRNQYTEEGAAVEMAESLASKYGSEFYVLKAVKVVRRQSTIVTDLE